MPVDNDQKRVMRDLGKALVEAIAASPGVNDAIRRIQREGYSLSLVLDRNEKELGTRIALTPTTDSASKPAYLLNKDDVSFLKSVGIDATRLGKRRRAS